MFPFPTRKERPLLGMTGYGGGAGGLAAGGGVAPGISATGGDATNTYEAPDGQAYKCHIFTSSGSLVVSDVGALGAECEFVVVGGGGGAANQHSGAGGAGGYRSSVVGELSGGPASSGTNANDGTTWSAGVTAAAPGGFDKPAANAFTGNCDNTTRLMTTGDGCLVTMDFSPNPITVDAGGEVIIYQEGATPCPSCYYGGVATITVSGTPYTSGSTPGSWAIGGRVVHPFTIPGGGSLTQATCIGGPGGRTYIEGMSVNGIMLQDGVDGGNGIGAGAEDVQVLTATTYPVVIGAGGAGSTPGPNGGSPKGSYGGTTTFNGVSPIIAMGGGGSGNWSSTGDLRRGNWGGSGGGGSSYTGSPGAPESAGNGTVGQGYPGGNGSPGPLAHIGGGGGGAGAAGENCTGTDSTDTTGGGGGDGRGTLIMGQTYTTSGTPGPGPGRWFAGGGGSGFYNPTTPTLGQGGAGGGANGLQGPTPANGVAGTINTGGGGGGSIDFSAGEGGAGGPGIVMLRYKISPAQM